MDGLDDVVIGGGMAGLAIATRLRQRGRRVAVIEAAPRAGGLVQTHTLGGCRLERGPQALQGGPAVWALLDGLGLRDRILPAAAGAAIRYILRPEGLVPLPTSPLGLARLPGMRRRDALRLLAEPWIPARRDGAPETLHAFVARRFGPAAADALVDPFTAGVFGGDPRALDAAAAFPDLVALERGRGGVVGGLLARARNASRPDWAPRGTTFTLHGGLSTLIDAFTAALGVDLHLDTPALSVSRVSDRWAVSTPHGTFDAERAWVTCPLPTAARLLDAPDLRTPTAPIAAVTLLYAPEELPPVRPGFGWLAPSDVRRDVLGCLWVDGIFPGHTPGTVVRRVMLGGSRDPGAPALPPDALIRRARRVLAEVEGIEAAPVHTDVVSVLEGIPQAPPGWADQVARWQQRWPNLQLAGWATTGIGLRPLIDHAARAVP